MDRDELIWIMAEATWTAHYCAHKGDHTACDNCKADGACFELSGGFDRDESWEWWRGAQGALDALEAALKIALLPEPALANDR
jgi:hypothetical protein